MLNSLDFITQSLSNLWSLHSLHRQTLLFLVSVIQSVPQCCIFNHCLFQVTWEPRIRHRLTHMILQSSGDDISLLEKQIISSYFFPLSFDQYPGEVSLQMNCLKSHIWWETLIHPCRISASVTSSILLGYKLIAVVYRFTRWELRLCSYCNFPSWALLIWKVTMKPPVCLWAPSLICNMVAISSHCQCSLSSQKVLIFLLSPSDSQPFTARSLNAERS